MLDSGIESINFNKKLPDPFVIKSESAVEMKAPKI
jgi:hypothetical protein